MSSAGEMNALYKTAYASGIEDLDTFKAQLEEMIPFIEDSKQNGAHYEQPVCLTNEHGFTYSQDSQVPYDLNGAIGMEMASAKIQGSDMILESAIGYSQAARASHSPTSFKQVFDVKFANMLKSCKKRLEASRFHGNTELAIAGVQTVSIVSDVLTVQFTTASWAAAIWSGSENALVVLSTVADNTAVDTLKPYQILSVDTDNRRISFISPLISGLTGGTLSVLVTALGAGALKVNYFGAVSGSAGTFAYAEMVGLRKIFTNTGSLFNIDAARYDLWRGNSAVITGQLTFSKLQSIVGKAVQRGLDTDAVVFLNPLTWADVANNQAALRRFDGSYSRKTSANGSEQLEFTSQNGKLTVKSYAMVKEGEAFLFPQDKVIRPGARDLSMKDPVRGEEEIFFQIPGKAGISMRAYTNQAIFVETPAQCVYISGIVNSTL